MPNGASKSHSDVAHLPVFSSTAVPPETGCSAATVSTAGPTGNRPFRATFFAGARFGLARFVADLAILRGLPRLAEFPLRSFARFGSFDDCFLRLAMIDPAGWYLP